MSEPTPVPSAAGDKGVPDARAVDPLALACVKAIGGKHASERVDERLCLALALIDNALMSADVSVGMGAFAHVWAVGMPTTWFTVAHLVRGRQVHYGLLCMYFRCLYMIHKDDPTKIWLNLGSGGELWLLLQEPDEARTIYRTLADLAYEAAHGDAINTRALDPDDCAALDRMLPSAHVLVGDDVEALLVAAAQIFFRASAWGEAVTPGVKRPREDDDEGPRGVLASARALRKVLDTGVVQRSAAVEILGRIMEGRAADREREARHLEDRLARLEHP